MAIQGACCSGIDAIGQAAERVASGESDLAICGGAEAPVFYHPMLELKMAGLAPGNPDRPERQCRPFDLWRTTGVIGEGACLFVLEPENSPRPGYAWVDGYSFTNNSPGDDSEGLERAIRFTLANAHTSIAEVDAISAWGPGHRQLDAAEAQSLRRIFGPRLDEIPASSIKGAIGNPLAAAGAIQVGAALLGMRRGFIPPTVNWEFPDPQCSLNLSGAARWLSSGVTLINGHGLLGTNSCLLLRRC
jgi:3-oxoacyl-(acyl-carrier-protein) synthase